MRVVDKWDKEETGSESWWSKLELSADVLPKLDSSPNSRPNLNMASPRTDSACGYPGPFSCPRIFDIVLIMLSLALEASENQRLEHL